MTKPGARNNGLPVNPITDVYAGVLAEIIESKRVPLDAREIIPMITNTDGIDLTSRMIMWVEYNFTGKTVITDLRPKTLPTIQADAVPKSAPLKWISVGIETTIDEEDDIKAGKVYPVNRTEQAFRVVAEGENTFLLDGFTKLGAKGFGALAAVDGIHVVAAGKTWALSTGEEIVEDIRKMKVAMVTGKKFMAKTLALPQTLDLLLDRTYTGTGITSTGRTIREVLNDRKYFDNIKSVLGIDSPVGLDDVQSNMGFVAAVNVTIGEEYKEGRNKITPIEEKISPFILFQPESVVKLTGTV